MKDDVKFYYAWKIILLSFLRVMTFVSRVINRWRGIVELTYYEEFKASVECSKYMFECATVLHSDDMLKALIKAAPELVSDHLKPLSKKHIADKMIWNELQLKYLSMIVDAVDVYLRKFILDFFKRHPDSIPENFEFLLIGPDIFIKKSFYDLESTLWERVYESLRWLDFDKIMNELKKLPKKHNYISLKQKDIDLIKRAKKIRNLVVHNSGIIDKEFGKKIGNLKLVQGKKFTLKADDFAEMVVSLKFFVEELNAVAPRNRDRMIREAMLSILAKMKIGERITL